MERKRPINPAIDIYQKVYNSEIRKPIDRKAGNREGKPSDHKKATFDWQKQSLVGGRFTRFKDIGEDATYMFPTEESQLHYLDLLKKGVPTYEALKRTQKFEQTRLRSVDMKNKESYLEFTQDDLDYLSIFDLSPDQKLSFMKVQVGGDKFDEYGRQKSKHSVKIMNHINAN